MKPEFEVGNDVTRRIVYVRMSDLYDEAVMHAWAKAYRAKGTAIRE